MKYLKTYEIKNKDELEIGDYVVCEDDSMSTFMSEVREFILNNVGQYICDNDNNQPFPIEFRYIIEYKNVPSDPIIIEFFPNLEDSDQSFGDKRIRAMLRDEIKFYSKDKEVCEAYITSRKYNL